MNRRQCASCWMWILLGLVLAAPAPVYGQEGDEAFCTSDVRTETVDRRGLAGVYCTESPFVRGLLKGAHATSYPVFYGGVPAVWVGAWAFRDERDFTDAYRLTVTQLVTYGSTIALKRAVGRPRPFVDLPVDVRSGETPAELGRYESFPSGHASLSVALATSWSLSHPKWYVIGPSALWAGAVTVSRLYLGVHYPSDVITGALLGATIATGVHLLRSVITPDALRPDGLSPSAPDITIRIRL